MIVSVYGSYEDVPHDEWDMLEEGATTYSATGWLGVRQEELPEGCQPRHLLARDGTGSAVASLETYTFTGVPHRLYSPTTLLSDVMDPDLLTRYDHTPFVVCSGWSEFRGQIPRSPGLPRSERSAAVSALAEHALAWAREQRAGLLAYLYLPLDQAMDVMRAHEDSAPVLLFKDVETVLSTRWDTFDDFLAWLPRNRRTRVRRELREFQRSGRRIRECSLKGVIDVIAPLNDNLMQKYGHTWFSVEHARDVYTTQAKYLAADSSVLVIEDGEGTASGFALRYRRADRLYSRVVGFDYDLPNHADYFNVLMFEPVRTGRDDGVTQINLGVGTYEAKLGRGALPVPLYNVFVGVSEPVPARPPAVERYNRARIDGFVSEFGHFVVGGLDTGSWLPPAAARLSV